MTGIYKKASSKSNMRGKTKLYISKTLKNVVFLFEKIIPLDLNVRQKASVASCDSDFDHVVSATDMTMLNANSSADQRNDQKREVRTKVFTKVSLPNIVEGNET
jgi:hypothetical protein